MAVRANQIGFRVFVSNYIKPRTEGAYSIIVEMGETYIRDHLAHLQVIHLGGTQVACKVVCKK